MSKIVIIGAGAMGSAFAFPCLDRDHDTNIIGTHLENEFIDELKKKNNFHPGLKTNIPKTINILKFEQFENISKSKIDLLVLGISSKGIKWVSEELGKIYQNLELPNMLMLTKGLSVGPHEHTNRYELLVDKLDRLLRAKGIKKTNISVVAGPCLAAGLANRVHSSVVIANKDIKIASAISDLLETSHYYHSTFSDDLIGVEVCAAIKNIYSMAIGASKGLCKYKPTADEKNNYLNTAASIFQQSIYEMEIFTEYLKGKKETVSGLAGLGDLYVSSAGGRNSKMGSYLGEGMTFSQAKKTKMENITVEGADLIFEIGKRIKEDFNEKQLPIMIAMIDAILEDKKLEIKWSYFN